MTTGPVLFARYAYPPNELGYCGPDDHRALLEYGSERVDDPGLAHLVRGFEGAWPYLELIASANGIPDPLDGRVVEAYWIGNRLLDRVDRRDLLALVDNGFGGRGGRGMVEALSAGSIAVPPLPHHAFHVLCAYPWVGLLRAGWSEHPLHVLDRCRIRWGTVVAPGAELVTVRFRPLLWDGRRMSLGASVEEPVRASSGGRGFVRPLRPGDTVSMHWDWVCDLLSPRQVSALARCTRRHIDLVNGTRAPAPALR